MKRLVLFALLLAAAYGWGVDCTGAAIIATQVVGTGGSVVPIAPSFSADSQTGTITAWTYDAPTAVVISTATTDGLGTATITTSTNHGRSNGDVVVVSNITGDTAFNGIWTITVTGATTFTYSLAGSHTGTAVATSKTGLACNTDMRFIYGDEGNNQSGNGYFFNNWNSPTLIDATGATTHTVSLTGLHPAATHTQYLLAARPTTAGVPTTDPTKVAWGIGNPSSFSAFPEFVTQAAPTGSNFDFGIWPMMGPKHIVNGQGAMYQYADFLLTSASDQALGAGSFKLIIGNIPACMVSASSPHWPTRQDFGGTLQSGYTVGTTTVTGDTLTYTTGTPSGIGVSVFNFVLYTSGCSAGTTYTLTLTATYYSTNLGGIPAGAVSHAINLPITVDDPTFTITAPSSYPAIPNLSDWETLMQKYGAAWCAQDHTGNAVSAVSRNSGTGVVTVTTTLPHGLTSGQYVYIVGMTDATYNGAFIATVSDATNFTYTGGSGTTSTFASALVRGVHRAFPQNPVCNVTSGQNCSWYYAGGHGYRLMRMYGTANGFTNPSQWNTCQADATEYYRNSVLRGTWGASRLFGAVTIAMADYYADTRDNLSYNGINTLAGGITLRPFSTGNIITPWFQREAGWAMQNTRMAKRVGLLGDQLYQDYQIMIDLGMLNQVVDGQWAFQPFWAGIGASELVNCYEDPNCSGYHQAAIPITVKRYIDWLWLNGWVPNLTDPIYGTQRSATEFYYNRAVYNLGGIYEDDRVLYGGVAPSQGAGVDLNILNGNLYAWMFTLQGNAATIPTTATTYWTAATTILTDSITAYSGSDPNGQMAFCNSSFCVGGKTYSEFSIYGWNMIKYLSDPATTYTWFPVTGVVKPGFGGGGAHN